MQNDREAFSGRPDNDVTKRREKDLKIAIRRIPFELRKIYTRRKGTAFTFDQLENIFGIRESEGLMGLLPQMEKIPGAEGEPDKFKFPPQPQLENSPDSSAEKPGDPEIK